MAAHSDYFFTVTVNGEEYPAAMTNGALLRFSELTGHDFGTTTTTAMRDNVAIVYACVESGCRREGKPFEMSLMDFADATTPTELVTFAAAMQRVAGETETAASGRKKKPSGSSTSKA